MGSKKKRLKKRIVVTGGGSGGHIFSALTIITLLEQRYNLEKDNFLYIGGDLGMTDEKPGNSLEKKLLSKENFNQKYIRAGKLQRKFSLTTVLLLARTVLGFYDSYRILRKFKPEIVISTGGFVSVPVSLVAKFLKAEIFLHEQTASVGLANKIVSRFCKKIFVAFPTSESYFPKGETLHTGNLLRPEVFHKNGTGRVAESIKKMTEKQEKYPLLYISGGSLGSHTINRVVKDALLPLLQEYQIILQTGDNQVYRDFDVILKEKEKLTSELQERFLLLKHVKTQDIGLVLNNIDLFVGRAGANTVYEMGVFKIPSVFIPIPWVTHNEQEKNAQILVNLGLAEILSEGELTPENLLLKIRRFQKKERKYNSKEIEKVFLKNAGEKIIEEIGF